MYVHRHTGESVYVCVFSYTSSKRDSDCVFSYTCSMQKRVYVCVCVCGRHILLRVRVFVFLYTYVRQKRSTDSEKGNCTTEL